MLPQLVAFREVAEQRSFRAAARALNISQPALTQRIQTLEEQLGHALFERGRGGVRLTHEGERFLPYARSAIQAVRDGMAEAGRARHFKGFYSVFGSYTLVPAILMPWMRLMNQRQPEIALALDCGYPESAGRLFAAGLIDAAIAFEPINMRGLTSEVIREEKLILVTSCPPDADWRMHYVQVHWDDEFVREEREMMAKITGPVRNTLHFVDALRTWALAGPVSGYMALCSAAPLIASGQLRRVPDMPEFDRPIYATSWSRPSDPGVAAAARDILQEVLDGY
jgi:DNA-binding transcriptional LysR family regulator